VVVVHALDECEKEKDNKAILGRARLPYNCAGLKKSILGNYKIYVDLLFGEPHIGESCPNVHQKPIS